MLSTGREKKVELLLRDVDSLEDYVSDLFQFSPLPICFVSPINKILEANPSFEELSGSEIGDIVGTSIESFIPSKDIFRVRRAVLQGQVISGVETFLVTKQKKKIPVQLFARFRKNEKEEVVGYFLGVFNLTQIKKTEEELRNSQAALLNILEDTEESRKKAEVEKKKTQAIVESLIDGLIVLDEKGIVLSLNRPAQLFLDVQKKDLIGHPLYKGKGKPLKLLFKLVSNIGLGKTFSRIELGITEELILEVSNVAIREEKGVGSLLILHDVTRERVIERLKTEFVSVAAHQLRTPLAGIKWSLDMLLHSKKDKLDGEQREILEETYHSNERMINLVDSLLNVARIEEGRFVYKFSKRKLERIVQRIIENVQPLAKQKMVRVYFRKPLKPLPRVEVNKEKIEIAIQNLISNAVKYTPPKGHVIVTLKLKKNKVLITVKDTGIGIPEKQHERVFTKFFRAENAVRMETEGTGLGLFITKNIVEGHQGRIWFESKLKKGTTFYCELPLKQKR